MSNVIKDGNGSSVTVASNTTTAGVAAIVNIGDPSTGNAALVTQFHNTDGQSLGTVYGIMTGGVDQLLNAAGTLDRKRGGYSGVVTSPTGFANEVAMAVYNASAPTPAAGNLVPLQSDSAGNLRISATPSTTGGCLIYRNLNTTNSGVNIKSSAGQVYGLYLTNTASTARFVKLYNKATAPTVGTDTPVLTLMIPPSGGGSFSIPSGISFATGIGIAATQLVTDADTTAPNTNEVVVNVMYL